MKVIVDTPVWSFALRRRRKDLSHTNRRLTFLLHELIAADLCLLLWPIRQEILSGIRDPDVFNRLRLYLAEFEDVPCMLADFEGAAAVRNQCDAKGVACSPIDALICAQAIRLDAPIFTTDVDFTHYATCCEIKLASEPFIRELLDRALGSRN